MNLNSYNKYFAYLITKFNIESILDLKDNFELNRPKTLAFSYGWYPMLSDHWRLINLGFLND